MDDLRPHPDSLETMRRRGGSWAAYRNMALDSAHAGRFQFLKVGPGCTHEKPPPQYPKDTEGGLGWRYLYYGTVDLETGRIIKDGGKNAS